VLYLILVSGSNTEPLTDIWGTLADCGQAAIQIVAHYDALPGSTNNRELWARAFNRRAGGNIPGYPAAVQIRLGSHMQTYMNDLWSTGSPHN